MKEDMMFDSADELLPVPPDAQLMAMRGARDKYLLQYLDIETDCTHPRIGLKALKQYASRDAIAGLILRGTVPNIPMKKWPGKYKVLSKFDNTVATIGGAFATAHVRSEGLLRNAPVLSVTDIDVHRFFRKADVVGRLMDGLKETREQLRWRILEVTLFNHEEELRAYLEAEMDFQPCEYDDDRFSMIWEPSRY